MKMYVIIRYCMLLYKIIVSPAYIAVYTILCPHFYAILVSPVFFFKAWTHYRTLYRDILCISIRSNHIFKKTVNAKYGCGLHRQLQQSIWS